MGRLTGEIRRWIRIQSSQRVLARLRAERVMVWGEMAEQYGKENWDGIPAPLLARERALTEAIDAIDTVYY